jgi:hypothetical protein
MAAISLELSIKDPTRRMISGIFNGLGLSDMCSSLDE